MKFFAISRFEIFHFKAKYLMLALLKITSLRSQREISNSSFNRDHKYLISEIIRSARFNRYFKVDILYFSLDLKL